MYFLPYIIKCYHIMFIFIEFLLGSDRPSALLFHLHLLYFFLTHASLAFFFCFFIFFHSCCSHVWVVGKTLMHEFLISYSHTEWYLLFLTMQTTSSHVYSEWKGMYLKYLFLYILEKTVLTKAWISPFELMFLFMKIFCRP